MKNIVGIPTTRVSDLLVRRRIFQQVQYDQRELFRLQTQLSTGRQFELPGEEPISALRVMSLQRLLERKEQAQVSLANSQTYLSAAETAMSGISEMVVETRAIALGVIGTIATDEQRAAAVQQIEEALGQLMDAGNQEFRGRYLFAGSTTSMQPFRQSEGGAIEYIGNEEILQSYSDIDVLSTTNVTGSEAFGAISDPVLGSADLNPIVTYNTRLADLRGGEGISLGSIAVSDGTNISVVDLSSAETVADVAALIRANPPPTRAVEVEITATGLVIQLDPAAGDLSIREVGQGTTAFELGILAEVGVGNNPLVGADLDPRLTPTTRVDDVLGTRAQAVIRFTGDDNDIILEADTRGAQLNGVTIRFVDDPLVTAGNEVVTYDAVLGEIEVRIDQGLTRAHHVVDAINAAHASQVLPFTARLEPLDELYGGEEVIYATPVGQVAGQTAGGSGIEFDQDSGLQIVNDDQTYTISFTGAETIEDMLNILNDAGAGLLAEINRDGTGLNVRSRVSGVDFAIGENGGTTAAELGLRTFTADTRLDELNFGFGVDNYNGVDFTIQLTDGTLLNVDLTTEETIGDVLTLINTLGGGALTAQLARYGNGIELIDESTGAQPLTLTKAPESNAAIDLGLVPEGLVTSNPPTAGTLATAVWDDGSSANNELRITANIESWDYNNVTLNVHDDGGAVGNVPILSYDPVNRVLDIEIQNGVTTANDIITELAGTPAVAALFTITNEGASTGVGTVTDADPAWGSVGLSGGQPEILTGADVNPLETEGLFTALLRLQQGLEANDLRTLQRAMDVLDEHILELNFARAEVGARQQGLDVLQTRLDNEEFQLREVLSLEHDADMVEVLSNLTARQLALEATLLSTGKIFQMNLLQYI